MLMSLDISTEKPSALVEGSSRALLAKELSIAAGIPKELLTGYKKGIDKFVTGKYYRWCGPTEESEIYDYTEEMMRFVKSKKWHKCLEDNGTFKISSYSSGELTGWIWHLNNHRQYFEECDYGPDDPYILNFKKSTCRTFSINYSDCSDINIPSFKKKKKRIILKTTESFTPRSIKKRDKKIKLKIKE